MTPSHNALLASDNLNWHPIKRPLEIVGIRGNRVYPDRFALIHNRTGEPLDICSKDYKIHHPRKVISGLMEAFETVGLEVKSVDVAHGGKNVFITADLGNEREQQLTATGSGLDYTARNQARADAGFAVGQALKAEVVVRIGNTVGNPTKVTVRIIELRCLNGLTSSRCLAKFSVNHRNEQDKIVFGVENLLPEILAVREQIQQTRDQLIARPVSTETMQAYLLELSDRDLFNAVLDNTIANRGQYAPDVQRAYFLEALNSSDDVANFLLHQSQETISRTFKRSMEHLNTQPLVDEARGTLYQPYMAATYVVDHKTTAKGQYATDNRFDSINFGTGARIKADALELAQAYNQSLNLVQ